MIQRRRHICDIEAPALAGGGFFMQNGASWLSACFLLAFARRYGFRD